MGVGAKIAKFLFGTAIFGSALYFGIGALMVKQFSLYDNQRAYWSEHTPKIFKHWIKLYCPEATRLPTPETSNLEEKVYTEPKSKTSHSSGYPIVTEEIVRCGECGGDGKIECGTCDGYGYLVSSIDRRSLEAIGMKKTTRCYACDGKGYRKCDWCGGDGKCRSVWTKYEDGSTVQKHYQD
ncbi:MAG: hypothetical protein ACPLXC_03600 [Candidatus Pacearchaeota archaeon]